MPFQSKAQQRFAYANPEKFGGKKGLKEWTDATDFSKLPNKKKKKKSISQLPILKSDGGMNGMTTTSGGQGLVTIGQGSYPKRRRKKVTKSIEEQNLRDNIWYFFQQNPEYPCCDKLKEYCELNNIDFEKARIALFNFINNFINAGKSNESIIKNQISEEWIRQGIEIEYEHTSEYYIARKIALDHLVESFPLNYYDYLDKMEKQIEKDKNG